MQGKAKECQTFRCTRRSLNLPNGRFPLHCLLCSAEIISFLLTIKDLLVEYYQLYLA